VGDKEVISMKKDTINGTSRFKRFMNGRGFYVTLAACLLAAGGITVATFGEALFVSESATSQPEEGPRPVEQPVSDLPKPTTTVPTTTRPTTTTTAPQAADLYVLPMGNLVQKPFGDGQPMYCETMQDWRLHEGVDFAGEKGQTIKALADATVVSVTEDPLWGGIITLDHGMDVLSVYYGVAPTVKQGDTVKVGAPVGTLQEIPCECAQGAHLHLEMSIDGSRVDPVKALGRDVRYAE